VSGRLAHPIVLVALLLSGGCAREVPATPEPAARREAHSAKAKAEEGPTMGMLRTPSRDGTPIAYTKTGHGSPLVLVHGTGADHTRWAPLVPRLGEHFTVYAMDRRGRGGSGDAPTYALDREFEDIAAVVEATGEPAYLLGHSHGALCSLEALRLTDRVKRAVLYEPPILGDTVIVDTPTVDKLEGLLARGDRQGILETFYRDVVRMPPSELALLESLPAWQGRLAAAHTIPREERVYVMGGPEQYHLHPERFASVRVPTLLLLGSDSPYFFKAAIDKVHAALPTTSRVAVMPGQQHTAMNTAPELFLREVIAFLTEPAR
jgi:pimeloyl-ACP methyl ester carboxylesterase